MANLLYQVVALNREGSATNKGAQPSLHFRPFPVHECGDLYKDLAVAKMGHFQVHAQDHCRPL